jgi:hypothetical protein
MQDKPDRQGCGEVVFVGFFFKQKKFKNKRPLKCWLSFECLLDRVLHSSLVELVDYGRDQLSIFVQHFGDCLCVGRWLHALMGLSEHFRHFFHFKFYFKYVPAFFKINWFKSNQTFECAFEMGFRPFTIVLFITKEKQKYERFI